MHQSGRDAKTQDLLRKSYLKNKAHKMTYLSQLNHPHFRCGHQQNAVSDEYGGCVPSDGASDGCEAFCQQRLVGPCGAYVHVPPRAYSHAEVGQVQGRGRPARDTLG